MLCQLSVLWITSHASSHICKQFDVYMSCSFSTYTYIVVSTTCECSWIDLHRLQTKWWHSGFQNVPILFLILWWESYKVQDLESHLFADQVDSSEFWCPLGQPTSNSLLPAWQTPENQKKNPYMAAILFVVDASQFMNTYM